MSHKPYMRRYAARWCTDIRGNFLWVVHKALGGPQMIFYAVAAVLAVVLSIVTGGEDVGETFVFAIISPVAVLIVALAWLFGAVFWNVFLIPSRLATEDRLTIEARDNRIGELDAYVAALEATPETPAEIQERIELLGNEHLEQAHRTDDGITAFRSLATALGYGINPKAEGSVLGGKEFYQIRWTELQRFCARLNVLGLARVESSPYTFKGGREDGAMEIREVYYLSDMGAAVARALENEANNVASVFFA